MERDTLKKVWDFKIQYKEQVAGNAIGESEESVRANLQRTFGMAPEFEILEIKFSTEMTDEQLELMLTGQDDTDIESPTSSNIIN